MTSTTSCTKCCKPIPHGERYIAIARHTERQGRLGTVKVEEAELLAAYHTACAPDAGENAPVLLRFLTVGGAIVTVTKHPDGYSWEYPSRCLGCDWTGPDYHSVVHARDKANEHASSCRALPRAEVAR